jgi:hypothetical protein
MLIFERSIACFGLSVGMKPRGSAVTRICSALWSQSVGVRENVNRRQIEFFPQFRDVFQRLALEQSQLVTAVEDGIEISSACIRLVGVLSDEISARPFEVVIAALTIISCECGYAAMMSPGS